MALLTCDFFSDALEVGTSMTVVLPQPDTDSQIGVVDGRTSGPPPLLYLLHGLSDDHTCWQRYTAIGHHFGAGAMEFYPATSISVAARIDPTSDAAGGQAADIGVKYSELAAELRAAIPK